jgi:hypothetical protein
MQFSIVEGTETGKKAIEMFNGLKRAAIKIQAELGKPKAFRWGHDQLAWCCNQWKSYVPDENYALYTLLDQMANDHKLSGEAIEWMLSLTQAKIEKLAQELNKSSEDLTSSNVRRFIESRAKNV